MFTIGDFCIKSVDLNPDAPLPLELVEGCDSIKATTRNRSGFISITTNHDLIKLDTTYLPYVWDELIQTEHKIHFLTECLKSPSDFGYIRGRGLVKITSIADRTIVHELSPWLEEKYETKKIDLINSARLPQVDKNLTKLEEIHEFLTSAIQFVT